MYFDHYMNATVFFSTPSAPPPPKKNETKTKIRNMK